MKGVLIDSCGATATLVLFSGAHVLAECELPGRGFSAGWPGALRGMLAQAGWNVAQLQIIAVVHGPGSFTGVRVGLAAAKGLCEANGAQLVAVSRLAVLASLAEGGALAVLDAGRDEFYVRGLSGLGDASEKLVGHEVLAAASAGRAIISVDECVRQSFPNANISILKMTTDATMAIVMERLHARTFDDVAFTDANYVRGEGDIYARRPDATGPDASAQGR